MRRRSIQAQKLLEKCSGSDILQNGCISSNKSSDNDDEPVRTQRKTVLPKRNGNILIEKKVSITAETEYSSVK